MDTLKASQKYFATLLGLGQLMLEDSLDNVRKFFSGYETRFIQEFYNNSDDILLEIRFEGCTLIGKFDFTLYCVFTVLYFENINELMDYIRYCDHKFEYDDKMNCWKYKKVYISLKNMKYRTGLPAFVQSNYSTAGINS